MKKLNILNKFLIITTVVLVVLFIFKIAAYKKWDRYYYTSSVSNPEEFPIHIFGIWFVKENDKYGGNFYKDIDKINAFYSDWGAGEYYEAYEPEPLPLSLFVEYMDFRTKHYYLDTIALPKEKMLDIFKDAKNNGYLRKLSSGKRKMGLEFHVGIANEGNIIFWLTGDKYEKEFHRSQLFPKPIPDKIASSAQIEVTRDKEEFASALFSEIPDSTKLNMLQQDISNLQYKDSIPVYFKYLRR